MKLPNHERAIIPREKIRDYLLSSAHPVGQFKAKFFRSLGYTHDNWVRLQSDIRKVLSNDAIVTEHIEYGQKYVVTGILQGPSEKSAKIVTAWIILNEEKLPRFITAHPGD